jgi:hypothetical protein
MSFMCIKSSTYVYTEYKMCNLAYILFTTMIGDFCNTEILSESLIRSFHDENLSVEQKWQLRYFYW